ncbi:putative glycerophosphodiester phosphodiesterase, protein kinase RLK-Pelle-LRK10L-2 family [Arabidopsis thaliana]
MFKLLLKQYTYAELKITKSFSHTVGKGGFGTVYRGNLSNGRTVAVKVLKDLKGNSDDFINKVTSMSQTSHVNIVYLLGFCYEGSKRAIISEFLEHGSLDQLMSRNKSLTPDVTTLYGIALGVYALWLQNKNCALWRQTLFYSKIWSASFESRIKNRSLEACVSCPSHVDQLKFSNKFIYER